MSKTYTLSYLAETNGSFLAGKHFKKTVCFTNNGLKNLNQK